MHVWWFRHTFVHTHWYCTYHLCKYIKIKLYCILGDNITAEFGCKGTGKHVFNLTSIADHSKLLNLPEYAGGEDLKVNEVHLNGQYICICIFWSISMCILSGWIAIKLRFHSICILLYFLTPILTPKFHKRNFILKTGIITHCRLATKTPEGFKIDYETCDQKLKVLCQKRE